MEPHLLRLVEDPLHLVAEGANQAGEGVELQVLEVHQALAVPRVLLAQETRRCELKKPFI